MNRRFDTGAELSNKCWMDARLEALKGKAEVLLRQDRRREAIDAYRQLLAADPELPDCWYNLAYLLKSTGRFEEALEAYAQALETGVNEPEEVHLNRAVIYSDHLRREERARAELETALALAPGYVPAWLNLGNLWEETGEREQAISCYERILAAEQQSEPKRESLRYEALARMAHLRPPSGPQDPLLEQLRQAAGAGSALDSVTRANLLFALGRSLDRLKLFDDAFAAFEQANRLARSTGHGYIRSRARRRTDRLITAFAQEPPRRQPSGTSSAEPLFVCGMFRSGSTLVEQVLAAHPQVVAGGELDLLPRMLNEVRKNPLEEQDEHMPALAREYRTQVYSLFPQAREAAYITDKRPDNFLRIGRIKQLFPAAKIIHSVRNPLDNCLSIYFQHLDQKAMSFSSDLSDTGHYYGQYRRVMTHWKSLFAEDIFDFSYDAFVGDPVVQLEKLLAFLGLGWDDRCMQFHRSPSVVKTASYWQVRRPLYSEASGRWRNYAAYLAPLREALRAAGVDAAESS